MKRLVLAAIIFLFGSAAFAGDLFCDFDGGKNVPLMAHIYGISIDPGSPDFFPMYGEGDRFFAVWWRDVNAVVEPINYDRAGECVQSTNSADPNVIRHEFNCRNGEFKSVFVYHLNTFDGEYRGKLTKAGTTKKFAFRFSKCRR